MAKCLEHRFKDLVLLQTALTHRSAGGKNNERLEFLGDALLSYIMAEVLFERFPTAREGELTRLRASLVKGETLAQVARELKLGEYLKLGGGELKSGGWRRDSILADALEAILGAIYLDAGMEACKQTVYRLFNERLQRTSPANVAKDDKTRLQEYLQARQQALPVYRVIAESGDPHNRHFEVECVIDGLGQVAKGSGKSRRYAEQKAARKAFELMDSDTSSHV